MSQDASMSYTPDTLRGGAAGLRGSAEATAAATRSLQAAPLDPAMFGLTRGAPAFAAAVAAARDAQARGFQHETGRAGDLAGRADATAALGDGLTADSAAVARSAGPRAG